LPDLTIENRTVCETCTSFATRVPGSKGEVHIVAYGWSPTSECQYDWTCSCPAFKFRRKPCKHIEIAKPQRCGWNADFSSMEGHQECPKCGGPVEVLRIAV